jgi:hypothetical protein
MTDDRLDPVGGKRTQVARVLQHVCKEHSQRSMIFVGDMCEEVPDSLYAQAHTLGVPVFVFQEGHDPHAAMVFGKISEITGGAHCAFDAGSAQRLANVLKPVAAFASGGVKALAAQTTEAAKLLLGKIRRKS